MATATKMSRSARRARVSGDLTTGTLIASTGRHPLPHQPDPRPTYSCPECGLVLRVSGLGRHRVYFELEDDRSEDPVMNRGCPACGHGLPGKNLKGSHS